MNPYPFAAIIFIIAIFSSNDSFALTGRLLENTTKTPMAGALVNLKGQTGSISAVSDAEGRFVLSASSILEPSNSVRWKSLMLENGVLRIQTLSSNLIVNCSFHDLKGRRVVNFSHHFKTAGAYSLPLSASKLPGIGILRIHIEEESYSLRVLNGKTMVVEPRRMPIKKSSTAKGQESQVLEITSPGMIQMSFRDVRNKGDLGDIMMYRAEELLASPTIPITSFSHRPLATYHLGPRRK